MQHDCPTPSPPTDPASGAGHPDPLAGTGYNARRRIAQGATAEVYEAVHVGLGKRVVVKLLKSEGANDARSLERMRFEAQTLARLSHVNITAVSDCGMTRAGRPFYVMERLEGHTLLVELRRRGCLPVPEAVGLVRQLCDGLAAAHALGVIHRDIKLENLFLSDPDGARTLKILDFGIAKLLPDADLSQAPEPPAIRSQEGAPVGTPQFMSPEQVQCRPVDARTDVYGAALVLYELIAGRDPFWHRTELLDLLQAHVAEAPRPPSELAPQPIEPAIDDVVLRALSKRPEDRYASVEELYAALDHALSMQPHAGAATSTRAPEPGPIGRSQPRRMLGVVALVALGATIVSIILTSLLKQLH